MFITNVRLRTLPVSLSTFITGEVYGWAYLMAGAVLTTLPVIAAYVYLQRFMVEGLTAGSGEAMTRVEAAPGRPGRR